MKKTLYILVVIFISSILSYSQTLKDGSADQQLAHWMGKNSTNILDYIMNIDTSFTREEAFNNVYYLAFRTQINSWDPVEYQIVLREDYYPDNNQSNKGERKLKLIFVHPLKKSIAKQYKNLTEKDSSISLEKAATNIKVKRDTVFVDPNFKYYDLVQELFALEIPIIYERGYYPEGTFAQIYMDNIINEHYCIFPIVANEYEFSNYLRRLLAAMIDYFGAIDPYKNINED